MTTAEAYAACAAITRAEARNFYWGFVLLPHPRREAIYAQYAFSRRADDAVDEPASAAAKLAAVSAVRRDVDAVYGGAVPPDDAVLVALADTVRRFAVPRRHLDALMEGIEMDLTIRRYRDSAQLSAYCERVAGAVGLASLSIFGYADRRAPALASDLGVAMQLVNIIRDVAEDAGRDRIYLPQDAMAVHGVSEEDVLSGRLTPGMRALLAAQGARAHELFASAEGLLPMLDRRARACVAMLGGMYRAILREIERRDYDVFSRRVSLSAPHKLALMARNVATGLARR